MDIERHNRHTPHPRGPRPRTRRLAARAARAVALVVLASSGAVLVAGPAQAAVDNRDCESVPWGTTCYQYELLREETAVQLSAEEEKLYKEPGASGHEATSSGKVVSTSEYKITNAVSAAAAFGWSFGLSGGPGNIATPAGGALPVTATGEVSGSGSITVTRTTEMSIGWSSEYTINHGEVPVRRGYRVFSHVRGNRYEVNQRPCEKKIWGLWCYEWRTMVVEVPTGIGLREQPLGWGATQLTGSGDPTWITYQEPGFAGKVICGGIGVYLQANLATNTYLLGCGQTVLARGNSQNSNVRENAVRDLDSVDVTLTTGGARGTVRIVRAPYRYGNATRALTMSSLTVVRIVASPNRGTFNIRGWNG